MTPEERRVLQTRFAKESGYPFFGSKGEYDIDYIEWLERQLFEAEGATAVLRDIKQMIKNKKRVNTLSIHDTCILTAINDHFKKSKTKHAA